MFEDWILVSEHFGNKLLVSLFGLEFKKECPLSWQTLGFRVNISIMAQNRVFDSNSLALYAARSIAGAYKPLSSKNKVE